VIIFRLGAHFLDSTFSDKIEIDDTAEDNILQRDRERERLHINVGYVHSASSEIESRQV
jgi:hypothetical protein